MKYLVLIACVVLVIFLLGCGRKGKKKLEFIGYTFDCNITDYETYLYEVKDFTNIVQLCPVKPDTDITDDVALAKFYNLKPVLFVEDIFVYRDNGKKLLYFDYKTRWAEFLLLNDLSDIYSIFIVDEPIWTGLSNDDIKAIADTVKKSCPNAYIMLNESHMRVKEMIPPDSVDWVSMSQYGVRNPHDAVYLNNLFSLAENMKSHQKMFLIIDAWWSSGLHGANGIALEDMGEVALNYYELAKKYAPVHGMAGFIWNTPSYPEVEVGLRDMPDSVIETHKNIAREIKGG